MTSIQGFPAIAAPTASVLILGSMPGEASLRAQQYYAHPRNAFWKIMAEVLKFDPTSGYATRISELQRSGVALWDVLHSCHRAGSLDTAIQDTGLRVNEFVNFFETYSAIKTVCFNGSKAEALFKKHVSGMLPRHPLRFLRLPSTSPAHAGMRFEEKLTAWQILQVALRENALLTARL